MSKAAHYRRRCRLSFSACSRRRKRLRLALMESQDGRCYWCKVAMILPASQPHEPHTATLDHVVAIAKGGADDVNNIVLACHQCNERRGHTASGSFSTKGGAV